jgi:acyl-CoA synthetase (AMP-forming)/AMP-acid ligase II
MTVRVVDETGNILPERRIGEIVVQSPSLMEGYFGNPQETGQALRGGRLYSGDLGYLAGGNLYLTGRRKEVIIVGGRSYYPDDVEQVVTGVDGVRMDRAVAIGIEDAERATEKLVVLAETDQAEEAGRQALRLSIRQALLAANYPIGEVVLLKPKSIQSTLTGKLRRMDCKTRYLTGEFHGS